MKSIQNFYKQAGYDPTTLNYPTRVYAYYAYKEGQSYKFDTKEEASKVSKNVERVVLNQKEIDTFAEKVRAKQSEGTKLFYDYIRSDMLPAMTDEQYNIIHNYAYEQCHAYGHEDIASRMIELATMVGLPTSKL